MTEPFRDSRLSLGRADFHIQDFERQLRAFTDAKPYTPVVECDLERNRDIHKVVGPPIPETFPLIVFDAVNNLRAALDRAAFATARVRFPETRQAQCATQARE